MALPLVSDVYTRTRALLGDDLVTGGEIFTDTLLQPHYQTAYEEMYRELDRIDSTFLDTDVFYLLPANTSYLTPATAGIANLGELIASQQDDGVAERAITGTSTVTAATPGSASLAVTMASGIGVATGGMVTLSSMGGLTNDANGTFSVTVTGATTVTVNGCTATGTYTSGGVISCATEQFQPVRRVDRIDVYPTTPGTSLQVFSFDGDVFRFYPCSSQRQIRIRYAISGNAPTTTTATIPVDDSVSFLAARTGQLASGTRGMPDTEERLRNMAARFLDTMLDNAVKSLQQLPANTRRGSSYALRPTSYWV